MTANPKPFERNKSEKAALKNGQKNNKKPEESAKKEK